MPEVSCPSCDFVDLRALDLDVSGGTYRLDGMRSALDTGLSPDADLITEVVLTEDSPGTMTWVVGLDQPTEFVLDTNGQAVELLVTPRE